MLSLPVWRQPALNCAEWKTGHPWEAMNIHHLTAHSLRSTGDRKVLSASLSLCSNILHEDSLFLLVEKIIFDNDSEVGLL